MNLVRRAAIAAALLSLATTTPALADDGWPMDLGDYVELALHDPRSPLLVEGRRSGTLLTARAELNPVLAFRLGLIGVWLDDVAHPSVVH